MKTLNYLQAGICVVTLVLMSNGPSVVTAQQFGHGLGQQTFVDSSVTQLEIVVGAAQRLKFPYSVPELVVEVPDVVKATAVSPNEILISGLKPGLTNVTFFDQERNLQVIAFNVTADTRKLESALNRHFPDSKIKVHGLQTGVILKGTVTRAEDINTIMTIAKDYFPTTVINQLSVDGSQLVAIKVKVYDVNRSKLRSLGVDWALFGSDFGLVSSVSDLIQAVSVSQGNFSTSGTENISFGVLGDDTDFFKFIEALEQHNVAKLMDQPVLVAQNGRPAEFLSGGEIPIAIASGLGTNSIEFRPFGTKLDMVPLIHGQGELTLEVRAEVSEVDNALSFGSGVPGFRVRRVNTGVRMKAGHTLALAGDYQESVETEKRGIPFLMDSPIWGSMFRRVQDQTAENELVFLITPRFISEVDPSQAPCIGPGQLTESPSNHEFYFRGYNEVPKCNDNCPTNDRFDEPNAQGYQNYSSMLQEKSNSYDRNQSVEGTFQQSGYNVQQNSNPMNYSGYPPVGQSQPVQNGQTSGGFGWPQGNK